MRWPLFIVAAYLFLVLQLGLAPHLAIPSSWGRVEPQVVLLLAVFVALAAPTATTVAACAALGIVLDLAGTHTVANADAAGQVVERVSFVLVGPYTLGYMAGGYLVVQFRPMLFRQHPMTLATMTLIAGAAVHLVVLGVFTVRRFYEPMGDFSASSQLAVRGLSVLYTGAIGVLLAYPLGALSPFFGFQPSKSGQRPRG